MVQIGQRFYQRVGVSYGSVDPIFELAYALCWEIAKIVPLGAQKFVVAVCKW
jgi:hypothetical protein